jgi:hypothetical protein
MPDSFLHERSDFRALVATVADTEKINDPALVEKDYYRGQIPFDRILARIQRDLARL